MSESVLSEDEFAKFCELTYRVAGISIPDTKRILVANRVRRRLRATGIKHFADYYAYLNSPRGTEEMPLFLDAITTNETYFDRDAHQYQWLTDSFLPELIAQARLGKRPKRLRIWSAACSTGAEPYSIALRIAELRHRLAGWDITILGTDISGAALTMARSGTYDARAVQQIDPKRLQRYFEEDAKKHGWVIKPEIRDMVTWKRHNLLEPLREEPFDCIFLKNVLIYFNTDSKRVVVTNLLRVLAPGGYLVVGPTEGVFRMLDPLIKRQTWLYQNPCPESGAAGRRG